MRPRGRGGSSATASRGMRARASARSSARRSLGDRGVKTDKVRLRGKEETPWKTNDEDNLLTLSTARSQRGRLQLEGQVTPILTSPARGARSW
eukprot:scaffold42819_cov54-Phaeocystis_antarctica.AAC.5